MLGFGVVWRFLSGLGGRPVLVILFAIVGHVGPVLDLSPRKWPRVGFDWPAGGGSGRDEPAFPVGIDNRRSGLNFLELVYRGL